jgi:hypothetical protein
VLECNCMAEASATDRANSKTAHGVAPPAVYL